MARIDWTHIRVTKETRERLAAFAERLRTAYEQGQFDGNDRSDVPVTLDLAIATLLDRDDAKRNRSVKAREKARGAKRRPAAEAGS